MLTTSMVTNPLSINSVIILQLSRAVAQHIICVVVLMTTVFTIKVAISEELPEHIQLFIFLKRVQLSRFE